MYEREMFGNDMSQPLTERLKPYMESSEINKIESILQARSNRPIEILEWGIGGSTVHFSNYLKNKKLDYRWTSVEHDEKWYNKVIAQTESNSRVKIQLVPIEFDETHKVVDAKKYIAFPSTLDKKFDFVLVDGMCRPDCLYQASKLLQDDGVVLLHDAQRVRYHKSFKLFSYSRFIEYGLWVGTLGKSTFTKKLANIINYIRYRIYKIIVVNLLRISKIKMVEEGRTNVGL